MTTVPDRPLLLVISGPSGSGKTTLCDRLVREFPRVVYSVSCTTRPRRPGETDGVDYRFLEAAAFQRDVEAGLFLEHAEVHGHRYGTRRAAVFDALTGGRDVLMDIDVQGAAQIRAYARGPHAEAPIRDGFVDLFILPPSLDALARRLRGRGQDADEVIARRLENAAREIGQRGDYRYAVVNDELDRTYDVLRCIYVAEHHRTANGRKD
jgi:guanylate kinase